MSSTHRNSVRTAPLVLQQLRSLFPLMLAIYVPALLLIALTLAVNLKTGIPIRCFFIDPVAEFNAPMYIGLLSNFGVLLWCCAASVCLFGGFLLFKHTTNLEGSLFLLCSGAITSLLMLDDLYLLHEEVLPDHLMVPQKLVFAAYGGLIVIYFFRFRKVILASEYSLLAFALVFFAASVFVDLFVTPEEFYITEGVLGRHLIEDGLKLMGIVSWAAYLLRVCIRTVEKSLLGAARAGVTDA